jgi:hypothetical protein
MFEAENGYLIGTTELFNIKVYSAAAGSLATTAFFTALEGRWIVASLSGVGCLLAVWTVRTRLLKRTRPPDEGHHLP